MRKLFAMAWLLLLAGILCLAQQEHVSAFWQSRDSNYNIAIGGGGSSYTGPGDIVSGAKGWWGLRAYSAAYATGSNPAADIKRASDSTSTTINILSNGKLDTATASTFCNATTCSVTKLYDQSGNGNNSIGTGGTIALTFNSIGTLPCMTFPGSADFAVAVGGNIAQPWTISAVAERTGAFTSFGSILGDTSNEQLMFSSSANTMALFAGTLLTGTATDSSFHAFQGVANSTSSVLYIDGTSNAGNAGTGTFLSTGAEIGGGFGLLTGEICEVGIWPSAFSSGNQSAVNGNQHTFWGF